MARGPGQALPKYRKHRASGQAIVTISGKDHYLGPHGTKASKYEYDRLIAEWLAAGRPAVTQQAEDETTVAELLAAYLRFAKTYYRDKDGKSTGYVERLKPTLKVLRELYGNTATADIRPKSIEALQAKFVALGHSRQYVNQSIAKIRRTLRWGVAKELVPPDILRGAEAVDGLKRGRTDAHENRQVKPVDQETVDATIKHLPKVVADMVRLQRLTGSRPQDVYNLRPCDVDTDGKVWLYRPSKHKTEHHGRDRVVLIGPKGQDVLRPYLLRAKDAFCFSPADSERKRLAERHEKRETPLSCGNRPGSRKTTKPKRKPRDQYDRNSYARAVQRACDKAKVERWAPNQLRHSAATELRKNHGLEVAQIVLGHAKADITQVYAERDLSRAVEIMAEVG